MQPAVRARSAVYTAGWPTAEGSWGEAAPCAWSHISGLRVVLWAAPKHLDSIAPRSHGPPPPPNSPHPAVSGRCELGPHHILPNYFEQNQAEALDLSQTVIETLVRWVVGGGCCLGE